MACVFLSLVRAQLAAVIVLFTLSSFVFRRLRTVRQAASPLVRATQATRSQAAQGCCLTLTLCLRALRQLTPFAAVSGCRSRSGFASHPVSGKRRSLCARGFLRARQAAPLTQPGKPRRFLKPLRGLCP